MANGFPAPAGFSLQPGPLGRRPAMIRPGQKPGFAAGLNQQFQTQQPNFNQNPAIMNMQSLLSQTGVSNGLNPPAPAQSQLKNIGRFRGAFSPINPFKNLQEGQFSNPAMP